MLGISFLLLKTRLAERIVEEQKNANVDALTGCGNRRAYISALEGGVEQGLSYLAIDINGLKEVNDKLGHDEGDRLIIGAAQCIEKCFGERGRVFRTGGDEFVVLTTEEHLDTVLAAYEKQMQAWSEANRMELSTSYGCAASAEYPESSLPELAKIADRRMLQAKTQYYRQTGRERRRHVDE